MKKIQFSVEGMHCKSCEAIIKRAAKKVKGVNSCEANYANETCIIEYDEKKTNLDAIFAAIDKKGYECKVFSFGAKKEKKSNLFGIVFGIIGFFLVIYFLSTISNLISMPDLSQKLSYGLILMIGLITGLHCVTMCGGFIISYTTKDAKEGKSSYTSHLKYGFGKTLSYTLIGALFGFVGSIIAFTPKMRGVAGVIAGVFLIIYGLKMLNVFPSLRKFGIKTPKFVKGFVSKSSKKNSSNPLVIGLLNGLMIACGPLQAMYIMAAGTGSFIEGGKILFLFGIGTLPVLLSFGYITSALSAKYTRKILKGSAFIVILLGVIMLNEGLTLSGSSLSFNSISTSVSAATLGSSGNTIESNENLGVAVVKDGYQEIRMEVNRYGWSPDTFVIQKDIPVRWIIDGKEINGCNNAIIVSAYGLDFPIKSGEQVIEFTPTKSGVVSWSCWMGMIPGSFIVKDEINAAVVSEELNILANTPKSAAPSCGASGGGCGCGG